MALCVSKWVTARNVRRQVTCILARVAWGAGFSIRLLQSF